MPDDVAVAEEVQHFMETTSLFLGGNMLWQKCSGIRRSYLDCSCSLVKFYFFNKYILLRKTLQLFI
ncbi:hypothetical protein AAW09_04740 [Escherichia coli]|nr:hypothetical protein AAW09_04740 [Escherichia coli]